MNKNQKNCISKQKSRLNPFTEQIKIPKIKPLDSRPVAPIGLNQFFGTVHDSSSCIRKQELYKQFIALKASQNIPSIADISAKILQRMSGTCLDDFVKNNPKIFEKSFELVFFSYLFSPRNELLGDKYRPLFVENLFSSNFSTHLQQSILGFFNARQRSSEGFTTSGCHYDDFKQALNSAGGMNSNFSTNFNSKEPFLDPKKIALVVNGPSGSGKSAALKAFVNTFDFEVEHLDLSAFSSFRELTSRFSSAVLMKDVKISLKTSLEDRSLIFSENSLNRQPLPPSSISIGNLKHKFLQKAFEEKTDREMSSSRPISEKRLANLTKKFSIVPEDDDSSLDEHWKEEDSDLLPRSLPKLHSVAKKSVQPSRISQYFDSMLNEARKTSLDKKDIQNDKSVSSHKVKQKYGDPIQSQRQNRNKKAIKIAKSNVRTQDEKDSNALFAELYDEFGHFGKKEVSRKEESQDYNSFWENSHIPEVFDQNSRNFADKRSVYWNKRKLYICHNIDFFYKTQFIYEKSKFAKKIRDFYNFLLASAYPFIMVHPAEFNDIYGKFLPSFHVIEKESPSFREIDLFVYLITFFEISFGTMSKALMTYTEGQTCDSTEYTRSLLETNIRIFNHYVNSKPKLAFPSVERICYLNHLSDYNLNKIYSILQIGRGIVLQSGPRCSVSLSKDALTDKRYELKDEKIHFKIFEKDNTISTSLKSENFQNFHFQRKNSKVQNSQPSSSNETTEFRIAVDPFLELDPKFGFKIMNYPHMFSQFSKLCSRNSKRSISDKISAEPSAYKDLSDASDVIQHLLVIDGLETANRDKHGLHGPVSGIEECQRELQLLEIAEMKIR
jgi:hypothetical protein